MLLLAHQCYEYYETGTAESWHKFFSLRAQTEIADPSVNLKLEVMTFLIEKSWPCYRYKVILTHCV